ncbi:MAG: hypothetical protein JOZ41_05675, partial [Chloroflexi bacterium]|nr:hypothetical protein [Chloroflexota bacterium]
GISGTLGTVDRPGTNPQVTYDGFPVYMYYQDKAPGDANGQGTQFAGGEYTVIRPQGVPLAATAVERLAVHITATGTAVRGRVSVRYVYLGRQVERACGSAGCQFFIPYGVTVHLTQRPTDAASWPFKQWRIRSIGTGSTARATSRAIPAIRMTDSYRVTAVYTAG